MTDKELLSYIQEIQNLMIKVATGDFYNEEVDKQYKGLYFKIKSALKSRSIKHNNKFSSLSEFYKYWSENLATYRDRRYYVHKLYKEVEEKLYLGIEATRSEEDLYSISFDDLHEEIVLKCKEDFNKEKYDDAALNALKLVEIKVREKGGFTNSDYGRQLMEKAFNPKSTPFILEGNKGEAAGWAELFKGVIGALKNPHSHRAVGLKEQETFQMLCLASYLLSLIDNLTVKETPDEEIEEEMPF